MRRTTLAAAAVLTALLSSSEASAVEWRIKDTTIPHERTDVNAFVMTPWFVGIGGGARVGLPIVPNGFIGALNDAVFLDLGAQFEYVSFWFTSYLAFSFPVLARWEFYLTDMWSVYAVFGFAISLPLGQPLGYSGFGVVAGTGLFAIVAGLGANWHFTEHMSVRLEMTDFGLQAGLAWQL